MIAAHLLRPFNTNSIVHFSRHIEGNIRGHPPLLLNDVISRHGLLTALLHVQQVVSEEVVLDLVQRLALGLGYEQVYEQRGGQRGSPEEPEDAVRLQKVRRLRINLGGPEKRQVEHGEGDASCRTAGSGREHFAQHQTGQHEKAERVEGHVSEYGGGRQPGSRRGTGGEEQPEAEKDSGSGGPQAGGDG